MADGSDTDVPRPSESATPAPAHPDGPLAGLAVAMGDRTWRVNTGGNSTYVRQTYRQLARWGVDVVLHRPSRGGRFGLLRSEGFAMPARPRADVVHYPCDTGGVRRSRVPVLTSIHGVASLHVDGIRGPVAEADWRFRVRAAARVADRLHTVSVTSKADVAELTGRDPEDIFVSAHGIDHDRFHPGRAGDDEILAAFALPDCFVGYVGNLEPRKNVIELIAGCEAAGVPLVIAGKARWDSEPIVAAVDASPTTTWIGQVDDDVVAPFMRAATVIAFPSLYEGFGLPVIEAMACATPVVCSRAGSLVDVAGPAGDCGTTRDQIAGTVAAVVGDDGFAGQLAEDGRVWASQFRWEQTAATHAWHLAELTGRAVPAGSQPSHVPDPDHAGEMSR